MLGFESLNHWKSQWADPTAIRYIDLMHDPVTGIPFPGPVHLGPIDFGDINIGSSEKLVANTNGAYFSAQRNTPFTINMAYSPGVTGFCCRVTASGGGRPKPFIMRTIFSNENKYTQHNESLVYMVAPAGKPLCAVSFETQNDIAIWIRDIYIMRGLEAKPASVSSPSAAAPAVAASAAAALTTDSVPAKPTDAKLNEYVQKLKEQEQLVKEVLAANAELVKLSATSFAASGSGSGSGSGFASAAATGVAMQAAPKIAAAQQSAAVNAPLHADAKGAGQEQSAPLPDCVVCLAAPRDVILLECGHICLCEGCAKQIDACPLCRKPGGHKRVFL